MTDNKKSKTTKAISTRVDAVNYLRRFGYLPDGDTERALRSATPEGPADDAVVAAGIAEFQAMANLPRTGVLDERTAAAMNRPRCGTPDRQRGRSSFGGRISVFFVAAGTVWQRSTLDYQITGFTSDLTQADQRQIVRTALDRWSAVVPLVFREVTSDPQLTILFATGDHNDGSSFDGAGQVLAHAFFPPSTGDGLAGDIHFDDDETWQQGVGGTGIDLLTVAVHEIGHALGLDHTSVANSTMNPFYPTPATPAADDRDGIRSVYKEHIWVASLYRDVLGRRFDDGGLDGWVQGRFAGGTPGGIARGFMYSPEHSFALASELYFWLLDRAPDEAGLAGWGNALQNGMSRQEAIVGFLSSQEYQTSNPPPEAFVDSLYRRLLRREPDPDGFAGWVRALKNGSSSADVARGFLSSEEFCSAYVHSLYQRFLRRDPDEAGWRGWTDGLKGGLSHQDAMCGFVGSAEYRTGVVSWWT